jgi:hypothetical protein
MVIVIEEFIEIKVRKNNVDYYKEKGYDCQAGESIIIKNTDLQRGSHVVVKYQCDYCGEVKEKAFYIIIDGRKKTNTDSCNKCKGNKIKQTTLDTYGVDNVSQLEEIKQKKLATMKNNFGVEHHLKLQKYRDKQYKTNFERYGVCHAGQILEGREKAKTTNLERYGVENVSQSEQIREKINNTYYKNKTVATSKQQIHIYELIKTFYPECFLNYPESKCLLDIAIVTKDFKIDIEYDGWYWHKNKSKEDRKRDEYLKSQGWKILRIKSGREVPTFEQIKESINKLITTDKQFTQIIMSDWGEKKVN